MVRKSSIPEEVTRFRSVNVQGYVMIMVYTVFTKIVQSNSPVVNGAVTTGTSSARLSPGKGSSQTNGIK